MEKSGFERKPMRPLFHENASRWSLELFTSFVAVATAATAVWQLSGHAPDGDIPSSVAAENTSPVTKINRNTLALNQP